MTTINFDAPQEVTRAGIIAWLITADEIARASRTAQTVDHSKWKGLGPVGRRVLEGYKRAINEENFAPETCPRCFGSGVEIVPADIPIPSAVSHKNPIVAPAGRRCRCETESARAQRLEIALRRIPPRYQGAVLATLQPQPSRHPKQTELIPSVKANPDRSYFLCGKGDTGKSHVFWAIYRDVVSRDIPAFASALYDLVEEVKRGFGTDRQVERILPELEQYEHMAVFLDDVSKARPTEFVAELVFNFIDRIYRNNHQLVVTSQLSPEDLIAYFERVDQSYGQPIVRRMVNDDVSEWRMF